jgi:hypothetical protein
MGILSWGFLGWELVLIGAQAGGEEGRGKDRQWRSDKFWRFIHARLLLSAAGYWGGVFLVFLRFLLVL